MTWWKVPFWPLGGLAVIAAAVLMLAVLALILFIEWCFNLKFEGFLQR